MKVGLGTLNVLAICILTFLLVRLDAWSDSVADAVNAFSQTQIWFAIRTFFNVSGAEAEEDLMLMLYTACALLLSIVTVYVVNRLLLRFKIFRHAGPARPGQGR